MRLKNSTILFIQEEPKKKFNNYYVCETCARVYMQILRAIIYAGTGIIMDKSPLT